MENLTVGLSYLLAYGLCAALIGMCFNVYTWNGTRKQEMALYEYQPFYFSPYIIYKYSELNIIGCVLLSIFRIVINPLYCVLFTTIYLLRVIYEFFYWIFHIGRKVE